MRHFDAKHIFLIVTTAGVVVTTAYATQVPGTGAVQTAPPGGAAPAAGGAGPGARGGGRGGGLPGATPEQTQALTDMNAALAPRVAAAATARTELGNIALADVKNIAAITAAADTLRTAELALASARGDAFAQLQAGPNKLNAEQVNALIASGGNLQGGRGGAGVGRGRGH